MTALIILIIWLIADAVVILVRLRAVSGQSSHSPHQRPSPLHPIGSARDAGMGRGLGAVQQSHKSTNTHGGVLDNV
jgi:hypothetical protein